MATVLIVDDEPDLRLIVRAFLERAGHQALEATSGAEALELLAASSPDAVLLDLRMPGIDGWEVLSQLGPERLDTLPVVILSAHVDSQAPERARGLGARAYLAKPFTGAQLTEVVDQVLDIR